MALDPSALLAGPRGRRLCLEYLLEGAWSGGDDAVTTAYFWATRALDPDPGTLFTIGGDATPTEIVVSPEEAASALATLDAPEPTERSLRLALRASVDHAMYWQAPNGADALAATDEVRPVLTRVAEMIAASPHAQWWRSGVALSDQWAVHWGGGSATNDDPAAALAAWGSAVRAEEVDAARERPSDATARFSGTWWSTPSAVLHSTRSLGRIGPSELWSVEDFGGWDTAIASPVLPASARVLEIDGADAWIDLCRRHPLVVTASRRHDWYRVTGRDGGWVQPDWESVAAVADGVHLTVAGYLEAATRLLDVDDGWGSVIAGWAPDATYWFARTLVAGPSVEWMRDADDWHRA